MSALEFRLHEEVKAENVTVCRPESKAKEEEQSGRNIREVAREPGWSLC